MKWNTVFYSRPFWGYQLHGFLELKLGAKGGVPVGVTAFLVVEKVLS